MKALFVIDMQEDYVGRNNKYGYSANLIEEVNKRIEVAYKEGELIVYIKNRKALKKGLVCSAFANGLFVLSDIVFYKDKSDCFSNKDLVEWLNENHVNEIETIGVDGNCCVGVCAINAKKLGYEVVFPLKFVGVRNKSSLIKIK